MLVALHIGLQTATPGQQRKIIHDHAMELCLSTNYQELLQRVNKGQDGAELEWQTFSLTCLKLAAIRPIVYDKPMPIKLETPASQLPHNRARILSVNDNDLWKTGYVGINSSAEVTRAPGGSVSPTEHDVHRAHKQPVLEAPTSSDLPTANSSRFVPDTISPYLPLAQFNQLEPGEKLVLDMFPLLKQRVSVYTTAEVMRKMIECSEFMFKYCKEPAVIKCQEWTKSCSNIDHEKLFHRMNTGQEGALLEWQKRSLLCLQLAASHHIVHSVPLPITLDNDITLPPAVSTAHDRGRIKMVTQEMSPFYRTIVALKQNKHRGPKHKARQVRFPHPFSPQELGTDEDFVLDVSDVVTNVFVTIATNRKDMLAKFEMLLRLESSLDRLTLEFLRLWHMHLSAKTGSQAFKGSRTFQDDCCMLAVLARLIDGTPLRIGNLEQQDKESMKLQSQSQEGEGDESEVSLKPGGKLSLKVQCRIEKAEPKPDDHLTVGNPEHDEASFVGSGTDTGMLNLVMRIPVLHIDHSGAGCSWLCREEPSES